MDTNAFIAYLVVGDTFQKAAESLLEKIERGELEAEASSMSLLEVTYVLRKMGKGRAEISTAIHALLSIKNLSFLPITADLMREGADLCTRHNLSISDAIIAATAVRLGHSSIVTEDSDFDRLPKDRLTRKSMNEVILKS